MQTGVGRDSQNRLPLAAHPNSHGSGVDRWSRKRGHPVEQRLRIGRADRIDVKTHRCERRTVRFGRGEDEQSGCASGFGGQLQSAGVAVVQVPRQHRPNRRHGAASQRLIERPHAITAVIAPAPHDPLGRDAARDRCGGVKRFSRVDDDDRSGLIGDCRRSGDHGKRRGATGIASGDPFANSTASQTAAWQPSVQFSRSGRKHVRRFHRGAGRNRRRSVPQVRHQRLSIGQ